MTTFKKKLSAFLAAGALTALIAAPGANAVPITDFSTGLAVSVDLTLSDTLDIDGFTAAPNATESLTSSFGLDIAGTKIGGGTLTEVGDGFGADGTVGGTAVDSDGDPGTFEDADIASAIVAADFGITIDNNSFDPGAATAVTIRFQLTVSGDVTAGPDGGESSSQSVVEIEGDEFAFAEADAFFLPVTDPFLLNPGVDGFFDIFVDAGDVVGISGFFELAGLALAPEFDDTFSSTTGFELSIFSVEAEAEKEVPEPGALALFSVGLIGLGVVRRRRKQLAA